MSGTLMLKRGQDRPSRPIPAVYDGEELFEWVLKTSGWTEGEFHIDSDEERCYEQDMRDFYGLASPTLSPEQEPPTDTLPTNGAPESPADSVSQTESRREFYNAADEGSPQQLPQDDWEGFEPLPPSAFNALRAENGNASDIPEGSSVQAASRAQIETPHRPRVVRSPTPELSPSNSTATEDDNDIDQYALLAQSQFFALPQPAIAVAEDPFLEGFSQANLDAQQMLFAELLSVPTTLQAPIATSASTPILGARYGQGSMTYLDDPLLGSPCAGRGSALPMLPSLFATHVSDPRAQAGPSVERTTTSVRRARVRPYSRRERTRPTGDVRDVNDLTQEILQQMRCTECDYEQESGAGAMRSFKRHLMTHDNYKRMRWICRGVPGTSNPICFVCFALTYTISRRTRRSVCGWL